MRDHCATGENNRCDELAVQARRMLEPSAAEGAEPDSLEAANDSEIWT
jgi:hypothetical protein